MPLLAQASRLGQALPQCNDFTNDARIPHAIEKILHKSFGPSELIKRQSLQLRSSPGCYLNSGLEPIADVSTFPN
jgi:hypothetical protein